MHSDRRQGQGQLTCLCASLLGGYSLEAVGFTLTLPNHGVQCSVFSCFFSCALCLFCGLLCSVTPLLPPPSGLVPSLAFPSFSGPP